MTRILQRALASFFVASAALLGSTGCSKKTDEDQIRETVSRAVKSANEKRAGGVVEDAAAGFKGPEGADVSECRRILLGMFMQQGWMFIWEKNLEVKVEGDKATATLEALMARGNEVAKPQDLVPTNADLIAFELTLAKQDGAWKFTKATYRRAGP